MKRFIVPSADLAQPVITVEGDLFHHIVNVVRLGEGANVLIADGRGAERPAVIAAVGSVSLSLSFTNEISEVSSSAPAITIYQGLPKGDKIDLIIQKCTELGAAAIVPFVADRSIRRVKPDRSSELTRRWQRIAEEAARQSGSSIPRIGIAESLEEAVASTNDEARLLLWEEEEVTTLRQVMTSITAPRRVAVIIGPEGGITPAEAKMAAAHGFVPVTLGRNILRTETASIVTLSLLLYQWGDIGGPMLRHLSKK